MTVRSTRYALALSALWLTVPGSAVAAQLFSGPLTGAQEPVLPNPTSGSGFGTLSLSDDLNSIAVRVDWTGLTGPVTVGHIHCCSVPGRNAPVAIDLFPPAVASGFLIRTLDLSVLSTYSTGFVNANGGTLTGARSAFLTGLTSNLAYFNLHTALNPGGEIRGQILSAVPEPATWGMMLLGFGAVGYSLRRRPHRAVAMMA